MVDKDNSSRKFQAALQGVDLGEGESEGDIDDLIGMEAKEIGFGIGAGLGYLEE